MKSLKITTRYGAVAVALGTFCCANLAFAAEPSASPATGAAEKKSDMKMTDKHKSDTKMDDKKHAEMKSDAKLDDKDKSFMMEAAKGGLMEVEMGKMAAKKATNADVKAFGQHMVTDHSKANAELMALAKKKGVALDKNVKVEKIDEKRFDHEYMELMVKDHKKDVASFEKAAKNSKDADVKAFAGKTLPTLKQHLEMAKQTEAKAKAEKKS